MFYSKNYAKRLSYKKMPLNTKTPYRLRWNLFRIVSFC